MSQIEIEEEQAPKVHSVKYYLEHKGGIHGKDYTICVSEDNYEGGCMPYTYWIAYDEDGNEIDSGSD
ncbi:hypothetical protein [Diaphorobacter aerolatus]|uniref:Uncharacterized protein n=1 Tax=Diaphorobacter aerolatus TaxID=1288495 RepID=A0A7H0GJE1_9BURK|nr:hypothetical protein [Diaphorobacter aerolatus]QNP48407.1 hypothetical protein H9K75_21030 [Diaphorobacter aerolatus]